MQIRGHRCQDAGMTHTEIPAELEAVRQRSERVRPRAWEPVRHYLEIQDAVTEQTIMAINALGPIHAPEVGDVIFLHEVTVKVLSRETGYELDEDGTNYIVYIGVKVEPVQQTGDGDD